MVPENIYGVPIGKGDIKRQGKDVIFIAVSFMVQQAIKASEELAKDGIDVEVIDLRSIKPLDKPLVFESISKTGRLVIADVGWKTYGMAAVIAAMITEERFEALKAPVCRITLPDAPAPASGPLGKAYYPTHTDIIKAVKNIYS